MYRILSILIIVLFATSGCNNKEHNKEHSRELIIPNDIHYYITQDQSMRSEKRSVEAVLNKRVKKETLNNIALNIKNSDSNTYERTFIGYFIGGEDNTQGYWATTHFNPNLEVKILGLSTKEKKVLTEKNKPVQGVEIIGSWLDNRPMMGWKYTLLYKNKTLLLRVNYPKGGSSEERMIESSYGGIQKFNYRDREAFGEHFIINSRNELEFKNKMNKTYYTGKKVQ